jgi:hypothetical protein
VSVCLSVCYHSNCHILGLYVENKAPLGFSWQSQRMYCMYFVENALFKSSGNICRSPLPSSSLDELSIDEMDSDQFISRLAVYRPSDSSYDSTDSSLLTVDYQLRFLGLLSSCVLDLLICVHVLPPLLLYAIANSCGYSRSNSTSSSVAFA